MTKRVVLAVHGGAGIIDRSQLTSEMEELFRSALQTALTIGFEILTEKCNEDHRSNLSASIAVDAVEAAVRYLEDCPLFNAGVGSVFGNDGRIRMDASIMTCSTEKVTPDSPSCSTADGKVSRNQPDTTDQAIEIRRYPQTPQPQAGSVAGVQNVKNPISLARAVMERTKHVMLIGEGAEAFAKTLPDEVVETRPDDYFKTERRWEQLVEVQKREKLQCQQQEGTGSTNFTHMQSMEVQLDHALEAGRDIKGHDEKKFGTVGCVALFIPVEKETDSESDKTIIRLQLASATSTGGMTNQRFNRVGDTPIIGAGTYANRLCAISCTGHGEHFIRCVAAHDIAKRLEYKHGFGSKEGTQDGSALQKSVEEVVFGTLDKDSGGVIALDKDGNFTAEMNCPGMYHGWIYEDGEMNTRIFRDECSHKGP
jgi:beta-aspartyl-peptidase (threonine type)